MEILRPAAGAGRRLGSAAAARSWRSASCPSGSNCSILRGTASARMGAWRISRPPSGEQCDERGLAAPSIPAAWRSRAARIDDDAALGLDFAGSGHVRVLLVLEKTVPTLTLVESLGRGANCAMSVSRSCWARMRTSAPCPPGAKAPAAVQVEEDTIHAGCGMRIYTAHCADFGAQAVAAGTGHRAGRRGCRRRFQSGVIGVVRRQLMPTSPPMSSMPSAIPRARQLFKKVAGGNRRAIYQGKVTVGEGANGSDSRQTAKALLLGEQCRSRSQARTGNLRR